MIYRRLTPTTKKIYVMSDFDIFSKSKVKIIMRMQHTNVFINPFTAFTLGDQKIWFASRTLNRITRTWIMTFMTRLPLALSPTSSPGKLKNPSCILIVSVIIIQKTGCKLSFLNEQIIPAQVGYVTNSSKIIPTQLEVFFSENFGQVRPKSVINKEISATRIHLRMLTRRVFRCSSSSSAVNPSN